MSGGYFNYHNRAAADEIFGCNIYPQYGPHGFSQSKKAAKMNPLEDREISELVFDVFCLLDSFDYYKEADTSEEQYREDICHFKEKWLQKPAEERVREITEACLEDFRKEIYDTFGLGKEKQNGDTDRK